MNTIIPKQILENSGVVLKEDLKDLPITGEVDLSEVESKIEEVKVTADNALPKTGGEISGAITTTADLVPIIFKNSDLSNNDETIWYRDLRTVDKNGDRVGMLRFQCFGAEKKNVVSLTSFNPEATGGAYLNIEQIENQGLVRCTPTFDSYDNLVVTTKYAKDKFVQKLTSNLNIYVGGDNASDTADLFIGRGETSDKPFATLGAAIAWINSNFSGSRSATIIIQSNLTQGNTGIVVPNIHALNIQSDDTIRTITMTSGMSVMNGNVAIKNLKFVSSSSVSTFFNVVGRNTQLYLSNCEFSGTVTKGSIEMTNGAFASTSSITGSVTGRKYHLERFSTLMMYGQELPGSQAGYKDATSVTD